MAAVSFQPDQNEMQALLKQLKLNAREDSAPFFSEKELRALLAEAAYDIRRASYNALTRKAEDDSIRLPSGLSLPDNRAYWLGLAKAYRGNCAGCMKRADARREVSADGA